MSCSRTRRFIAVPGNHDLDCDEALPISWNAMGKARQEEFFNFDAKGIKLRSARAAAFGAYTEFVKSKGIASVNPLEAPAQLHSDSCSGQEVRNRRVSYGLLLGQGKRAHRQAQGSDTGTTRSSRVARLGRRHRPDYFGPPPYWLVHA
jgi:hypothetical protein